MRFSLWPALTIALFSFLCWPVYDMVRGAEFPPTGEYVMEQRVSIITLGVSNMATARNFYETGLNWRASPSSDDNIRFFPMGGLVLALYSRDGLADDAGIPAEGGGFRGVTLAYNVREKEEVAAVLFQAEQAGGTIVTPARDVFWGGHSGYFADPDGHLWEVAWNPYFPLNERGEIILP